MAKHGGVYRKMGGGNLVYYIKDWRSGWRFTFHLKLLEKGGEILQKPAEKVVPLPTEKGELDTNACHTFSFFISKNIG